MEMPKKNSLHVIDITAVTAKGFGVGHLDGFTVFVDGGLPGDKLQIYMVKAKSRYGYGKITEILTPSPHRIESPCPVFDRCGGCQWQNCEYGAQLGFKKQIVTDALERIGGIQNPPVKDVMGMLKPGNYRNKAVFPIVPAQNAHGGGFHQLRPVEAL
ncbi:MAG: TRAM domain-containing protein [Defluviitaleaceae bacterium]|nr:TRAM domain-containing protein [Defluviitaleaceae bacterium]